MRRLFASIACICPDILKVLKVFRGFIASHLETVFFFNPFAITKKYILTSFDYTFQTTWARLLHMCSNCRFRRVDSKPGIIVYIFQRFWGVIVLEKPYDTYNRKTMAFLSFSKSMSWLCMTTSTWARGLRLRSNWRYWRKYSEPQIASLFHQNFEV